MKQITPLQKIERLIIKYPDLKPVLEELKNDNTKFNYLRSILDSLQSKTVLIGRHTPSQIGWYILAYILKYGYLHITHMTTVDLLESYLADLEDVTRLSQVHDDLVIIKDSRSFVPNKQKPNMVSQVFEQNDKVLYYYVGTQSQFSEDMAIFNQYCEDNNIVKPKVKLKGNEEDII